MVSLNDAIVDTILAHLQLKPGMRVLDVGSGSGEYCFRLGSAASGVQFTGLEYDPDFVAFANRRASGKVGYPFESPNPANEYRFVCGDGLDLPFEDSSFDAVISHTYLTAVPDWACALSEMCRVCRPGGVVSSVTSMTGDFYGTGAIALFTGLLDAESAQLLQLVERAKAAASTPMDLCGGIPPRKAPVAFDWIGLEHVRCAPLAHYFCLSDALTTPNDAQRFVDLLCADERNVARRLQDHPVAGPLLDEAQWRAYENLIAKRHDDLLGPSMNREWNWYGNSSLLVCGTTPATGPDPRWASLREEGRKARAAVQACEAAGLAKGPDMRQLGPGRCVVASFPIADGHSLAVFGFDPPRAIMEGCCRLLAHAKADVGLPAWLNDLVDQEKAALGAEAAHPASASPETDMPALDDEAVFGIADMWETVSEASLANVSVEFKDAGSSTTCAKVVCFACAGERSVEATAAHPDFQTAVKRAFSRAIGSL